MATIEVLDHHLVYENPRPQNRARHGFFPGLVTLLTIHCHREGQDIGLFVRIVDLAGDQWRIAEEAKIWGNAPAMKVGGYSTMGQNLRFGQASLLRLDDGDILASHWAIEEGQGRIHTHRLRVEV